jgi:hypothetical protein
MNTYHKIDKSFPGVKELLAKTFPAYKGRKFNLNIQRTISFHDLNWDGGSRTVYYLVNTETEEVMKVNNSQAPWSKFCLDALQDRDIPKNCIIVSQACFCGKMMGIHFTVSSQNALAGDSLENILQTGAKRVALT